MPGLPALLALLALPTLASGQYACPATCVPPACRCASTAIPGGLDPANTPQFVTFTFDDAVQQRNEDIMAPILAAYRNPNGCPLPATYFTQIQYTDFALVQRCAALGHEIALHTMTHQDLAKMSDPTPEIMGSFKTLNAFAGVPKSQLRGFRAPFLSFNPKVFEVLRTNELQYDSSVTVHPGSHGYWPFTLDAGFPMYPQPCVSCPTGTSMKYPGLWEVPMYNLLDEKGNVWSSMDPVFGTAEDVVLRLLKHNFDLHYKKKLPFGLYQHIAQYIAYGDANQAAKTATLRAFIEYMQSFPDVWFVTNQQLINWVQAPVPTSQMTKRFPCIPAPMKAGNVEICDGVDNNLDGKTDEKVVQECQPDPMNGFSSCFGCPKVMPSLTNPVPETGSSRKFVPDAGCPNFGTWDPVAGMCVHLARPFPSSSAPTSGFGVGGGGGGSTTTFTTDAVAPGGVAVNAPVVKSTTGTASKNDNPDNPSGTTNNAYTLRASGMVVVALLCSLLLVA